MNNDDKKLVIITEPKLFILILEDVGKMLKHEINFIIKHNEILTEQAKKKKIRQLLSKYKHGSNILEHRKQ